MKNTALTLVCFIALATLSLKSYSQIGISNITEIEKIKKGTTYVAMKNPSDESSKVFIEIFKKYWTISKIEFIKYSDIKNHISPENSFFSVGGYMTDTQFINSFGSGRGIHYEITHIYLELWTCDEAYFKNTKPDKVFDTQDKWEVGRIELFTDFPTLSSPRNIYQSDYNDWENHIRNWGPGILKNQLQALMVLLQKGEKKSLYTSSFDEKQLKNLNTDTLFIPDYVMTKFNKFSGDESEFHKQKDLFEDYNLPYKIITKEQLNNKIITDKNGFYYMIYIKSSTDKYISIINSLTGEIVYSKYSPVSYNIKPGDLKAIQKKADPNN
ncbi:MAG: hypothetical protein V4677_18490 [Bacteroidota bacterium]